LDRFEPDVPPVAVTFYSFHLMAGLGMLFVALTVYALWRRFRGDLFQKRWLLRIFVFAVIGPFAANEVGWVSAEVGRQPWIVYNQLKTSAAVSQNLSPSQVLGSIIMFGIIYLLLFAVWIYLLNDKIQKGPATTTLPHQKGTIADALDIASRYPGRTDSLTGAKDQS
jgi:cytochrome d ubiquinol oxidase subunit I